MGSLATSLGVMILEVSQDRASWIRELFNFANIFIMIAGFHSQQKMKGTLQEVEKQIKVLQTLTKSLQDQIAELPKNQFVTELFQQSEDSLKSYCNEKLSGLVSAQLLEQQMKELGEAIGNIGTEIAHNVKLQASSVVGNGSESEGTFRPLISNDTVQKLVDDNLLGKITTCEQEINAVMADTERLGKNTHR